MTQRNVAVAFSGGPDSTALLHCTCRWALQQELSVHALHVHHGLQAEADAWVAHMRRQVARWRSRGLPVSLHVLRLGDSPPPGESVEAWARTARYKALSEMAQAANCGVVLLAHHRRDQAETVILQALRGGGGKALASMPSQASRGGICWVRPWLERDSRDVAAYVARHRLKAIADPMNEQVRFARNRLREVVWPHLLAAFPHAESGLLLTAKRIAQETAACQAWVDEHLPSVCDGPSLVVMHWLKLEPVLRPVLLRGFLEGQGIPGVPSTLVERLCDELPGKTSGTWEIPSSVRVVRLFRHRLTIAKRPETTLNCKGAPSEAPMVLDLSQPGTYSLPKFGGYLQVTAALAPGLDPSRLTSVSVTGRMPGVRFQAGSGRPPRALKKQYQAVDTPHEVRGGPCLWVGEQLVFVAGLGVDARWRQENEAARCGLELSWEPFSSPKEVR